ncbi:STAS domain-containing protein [Petroclostridium sp. X23]|uniref:STAS domain-containing protein n=1 Tax=Petroclostridium sp. X23 TaxID=3045146 RepID=UPI0024AE632D|nr:STAS domain-containing protein [Petroclostridium sp. X23]WHH61370.1 STAS domain-containing protein [Petroclostridium sp. X23]
MDNLASKKTNTVLKQLKDSLTGNWIEYIHRKSLIKKGLFSENEINSLCDKIVTAFLKFIEYEGDVALKSIELNNVKKILSDYSKITVSKGLGQVEVSNFIFSLKNIIFDELNKIDCDDNTSLYKETVRISEVLDKMGLFTFDLYVKEREEIILRQQQDMLELSTPVIQVWEGILAIPLIGTLDSKRTQMIMEKLLEMIVSTSSKVAIIDITGIPTVDTLVANHLLKTASATRLLGAELIITGISPVIAQTMIHLGVDLSGITTRAVMADGIKLAMELAGFKVVRLVK